MTRYMAAFKYLLAVLINVSKDLAQVRISSNVGLQEKQNTFTVCLLKIRTNYTLWHLIVYIFLKIQNTSKGLKLMFLD